MPQFIGQFRDRLTIADWLQQGSGLIAGSYHCEEGRHYLYDSSQSWDIPANLHGDLPKPPAWLALRGQPEGALSIVYSQTREASAEVRDLHKRRHLQKARWEAYQRVRDFFKTAAFEEVDTPIAVTCPGMEPYLDTYPVANLWLRTSPGLHMKRLWPLAMTAFIKLHPAFAKAILAAGIGKSSTCWSGTAPLPIWNT